MDKSRGGYHMKKFVVNIKKLMLLYHLSKDVLWMKS